MNAATLTAANLLAMGELTEARATMLAMGCEFFAEPRGGGVFYTGTLTDAAWALVDAAAAMDETAANAAAALAARPSGELCPGTNGF